ncbi:protein of unknown function [Streptantibioticus cattleyicolor NRRL 8057 = DSM 46488]|nr:protein of unknown function [Streptantibioticus cattleyicolor NRRL 8057 = DSM 46488]
MTTANQLGSAPSWGRPFCFRDPLHFGRAWAELSILHCRSGEPWALRAVPASQVKTFLRFCGGVGRVGLEPTTDGL